LWWCVALGHGRPEIVEAIRRQAGILTHSILGGLTHEPAIELAARLAALCPGDLSHAGTPVEQGEECAADDRTGGTDKCAPAQPKPQEDPARL